MIKHLYKQILKKRRRYYISAIVLFLSFFAFIVMVGYIYPDIIRSSSFRLPVPIDNRVELVIEWKTKEKEIQKSLKAGLKEGILKLNGVQAADFIINDLGSIHTMHSYDFSPGNSYFIFCGENFSEVFDLKLEQGKWFSETENISDLTPVVITRNHADYLGIQNVTSNSVFASVNPNSRNNDSIRYQITGIIENMENIRKIGSRSELGKNTFPVFSPEPFYENTFNYDERLILKMNDGYNFELLNTQVLNLMEKMNARDYIHQHRLTSLNDVLKTQINEHFTGLRMIYAILLILLTYIFVVLFGNFWKMTQKRTIEIGIRRALGHSRGKVLFYILAESLLFFISIMIPASFAYLNLYKIINISSPLPIYLISIGILFLVVMIATIIPAIYAGRVNPVQALADE
ncbi:MAG TPA: FtsX-like permease family protein [Bacteroidales bacterium]|nr:FtsX-like permease family protein [Bacteroidales bacterium]